MRAVRFDAPNTTTHEKIPDHGSSVLQLNYPRHFPQVREICHENLSHYSFQEVFQTYNAAENYQHSEWPANHLVNCSDVNPLDD